MRNDQLKRAGSQKGIERDLISSHRVVADLWCHHCKMSKPRVLCCERFFRTEKEKRCGGKYCESCLNKYYESCIDTLGSKAEWICFKCQGRCVCSDCRRAKGENVTKKRNKKEIIVVTEGELNESQIVDTVPPATLPDAPSFSVELRKEGESKKKRKEKGSGCGGIIPLNSPDDFEMGSSKVKNEEKKGGVGSVWNSGFENIASVQFVEQKALCEDCEKTVDKLKERISSMGNELRVIRNSIVGNSMGSSLGFGIQTLSPRNSFPHEQEDKKEYEDEGEVEEGK